MQEFENINGQQSLPNMVAPPGDGVDKIKSSESTATSEAPSPSPSTSSCKDDKSKIKVVTSSTDFDDKPLMIDLDAAMSTDDVSLIYYNY